jgi:uncharacterized protein (DUF1684 family)
MPKAARRFACHRTPNVRILHNQMKAKSADSKGNRRSTLFLIFVGALVSCCHATRAADPVNTEGPKDWIEWQQKRHESIAGTNGWTTLISRYWLPEGRTFAGADPTNQLVLPQGRVPACVGFFVRRGNSVRFEATPGVTASVEGVAVHELEMKTDVSDQPTKMMIGPLSFIIIERGDRFGVRAKDPQSPSRLHFVGLRYFPYEPSWRIQGRFEAFPSPRTMRVPEASGGTQEFVSPGALVFLHAEKEYRLDVAEEQGENDYFLIFTDLTAGHSTYAAGRFLYVAKPDAAGRVTIDFNRAYTPPCGFTPFATCPRPPSQNRLPFEIKAGELAPAGH